MDENDGNRLSGVLIPFYDASRGQYELLLFEWMNLLRKIIFITTLLKTREYESGFAAYIDLRYEKISLFHVKSAIL